MEAYDIVMTVIRTHYVKRTFDFVFTTYYGFTTAIYIEGRSS